MICIRDFGRLVDSLFFENVGETILSYWLEGEGCCCRGCRMISCVEFGGVGNEKKIKTLFKKCVLVLVEIFVFIRRYFLKHKRRKY